jgi:hypothetical protein
MMAALEGMTIRHYLTKLVIDNFEKVLDYELGRDIDKSIEESLARGESPESADADALDVLSPEEAAGDAKQWNEQIALEEKAKTKHIEELSKVSPQKPHGRVSKRKQRKA